MADYYEILGVTDHASQEDIRTAYRKLVIRYHPDRNPDPSAAEKIRQINVAYDVLSDPEKRRKYDLSRTISWTEPVVTPQPAHRDPAYHRRARPRPQSGPPPVNPWVVRYQKYARVISRVALVFCVLLLIDVVLPTRQDDEKIIQLIDLGDGANRSDRLVIRTNYGSEISFDTHEAWVFSEGTVVYLYRTRILSIPRRIASNGVIERIPVTLLGNFVFFPLVLAVTSVLGVFRRSDRRLMNSLGVVNMFLLFLCLLFWLLFR
ncbi:MAG: J domain-containing protein [Bacteroidota bacterium]|nr:MAG: hypothetical protein DIU61_03835 [Bacteroidota bacterium]